MKKGRLSIILAGLMLLATLWGIVALFSFRYERGDIYPPYSSLRPDPLGIQVCFETVNALESRNAFRNFEPFDKWNTKRTNATLIISGIQLNPSFISTQKKVHEFRKLADQGRRVVITLNPSTRDSDPYENEEEQEPTEDSEPEEADEEAPPIVFEFDYLPLPPEFDERVAYFESKFGIPDVAWNSTITFSNVPENWITIASRAEQPVIISQPCENGGELVIVGDSYFLSNQALSEDRNAEAILWIIGNREAIYFDETHHGVMENKGIAYLAKHYGMTPIFATLLAISLLWIWRVSCRLVPIDEVVEGRSYSTIEGRNQIDGLCSILGSNLSKHDILQACIKHWRSDVGGKQPRILKQFEESTQDLPEKIGSADLVKLYERISNAVRERKH